jgi:hypothetical protein
MSEQVDVLRRLARAIATSSLESPLSLRMCEACLGILGVQGGSFTLAYADAQRVTLCATDETAARLEDLQEVFGEGPSYAAYFERTIQTLVIDRAIDPRWPLLGEAVKQAGPSCTIYAIPMKPGPQTMGVATFYQQRSRPLLVDDPTTQLLVDAVAVALVKDPDVLDDDRYAKADSWNIRARIHQATGMVMGQLGLSPDDAMALIRAHAYAHRQSLSAISDEIIARTLDFRTTDPDPGNGHP